MVWRPAGGLATRNWRNWLWQQIRSHLWLKTPFRSTFLSRCGSTLPSGTWPRRSRERPSLEDAPIVLAIVGAFLLIETMGLCNTYGLLQFARPSASCLGARLQTGSIETEIELNPADPLVAKNLGPVTRAGASD